MTMGKIIQVRTVTGQEFPAFDSAGGLRVLNVRPTMPGAQRRSRYSDHAIVIPRSDWYETEGARPELPIKDQDGYSSCTGNGGARAMEQGYAIAGLKVPPLSASFAYAMVNGDVDRGANIGDILDILENMGLPTDATCPETLIFRSLIATHAPATPRRPVGQLPVMGRILLVGPHLREFAVRRPGRGPERLRRAGPARGHPRQPRPRRPLRLRHGDPEAPGRPVGGAIRQLVDGPVGDQRTRVHYGRCL
jgi:hypothetical protein